MRWLLLASLAACYQPTLHEGAPCGPGATCPTDQECRTGTCYYVTTPADASNTDVAGDTSQILIDAPPDGPAYIPWGTPVVNTSLELANNNEDDPSITNDRKTVVISAQAIAAPNDDDLYIGTRPGTTGAFTVTALLALNATPSQERSPEISADGQTIYFVSDRTTAGDGDVWMSTQSGGVWAAPTMVTELSGGSVGDMAVSPDQLTAVTEHGATFYVFTRASTTASWGTGTVHNELVTGLTNPAAPTITNGAATIYFHAGTVRDLYVSHRNADGTFQAPALVTELNTATRDAAPFVLQADNYMIFDHDYNIYEVTR